MDTAGRISNSVNEFEFLELKKIINFSKNFNLKKIIQLEKKLTKLINSLYQAIRHSKTIKNVDLACKLRQYLQ
jgi:hypothetical protein